MSETNQDSSSKAPNMQLQALIPTPLPNPKPEKSEKFDGIKFKRWQQQMLFYLTTLHLAKFLQENPPEPGTIGTQSLQSMLEHKVTSFAEIMF